MDVRMPGMDRLTAAEHVAAVRPAPKVIMLTTFDLDEYVCLRSALLVYELTDGVLDAGSLLRPWRATSLAL